MTRNRLPYELVKWLMVSVIFVTAVCTPLVARSEGDFAMLLFGLGALVAASFPILVRREFSLFEPIVFVSLLVLTGVTCKLMYIAAVGQDRPYIVKKLLMYQETSVLTYGAMVAALGMVCLSAGYCLRLPRANLGWVYFPEKNEWHGRRLQLVLGGLLVISLLFFGLFIVTAGVSFSSLEGMSAKRFSDAEGSSAGRINTGKYYFYRLAAFSKFVFYLSFTWMIHRRAKWTSWLGVVALISMLQTTALFFFMSSRASIVLLMIDGLMIYYLMKERIELRKFIMAGGFAVGLLLLILSSRDTSEHTFGDIVEKTFAGRDLMDISKTAHIINAVPNQIEYRNGETLYGFLVAPIPRSMWPEKPMWAERGSFLMMNVFGDVHGRTGMPPGLVAEFYWNFGLPGVCFGMFFMGLLFRQVHLVFEPYRGNPTSVLIYTIVVTRLTIFSIGNDFGTGFVKVGLDLIPLLMMLLFIGVHVPVNTLESGTENNSDSSESKADSSYVTLPLVTSPGRSS